MSAGTHTTRHALSIGTVYLLQNPEIEKKLFEELETAMPDINKYISYQSLEKLPYLVSNPPSLEIDKVPLTYIYKTGFIKESLRLSYGVVGPLPRVVPRGGATIAGQHFPENVSKHLP